MSNTSMTSLIIVSNNINETQKKIDSICSEYKIDVLDRIFFPPSSEREKTPSSLGIELVKNLQKKIFLKPLKSTHKIIVLNNAELLTTPAQNALLKIMEEPPENTFIILHTFNLNLLLPTIQSRCSIINLYSDPIPLPQIDREKIQKTLLQLSSDDIGVRLTNAEILSKNKNTAINFLENAILLKRVELLNRVKNDEPVSVLIRELECFQETQKILASTNTNPRLLLETLFLNL